MKTSMSLPEYRNHLERKFLAKVSSRITHFQTNPGWKPQAGGTDDPNNTTDITTTSDAQRQAVDNLLAVLAELDEMARVAAVNAIQKAYPNPNRTTPPNGQRFSRKR